MSLVDVSVSTLHAVERAVDDPAEASRRGRSGATAASVNSSVIMRRHVGLDHPDALGDADDAGRRRRRPCAAATLATVSVVMMPRPTAVGIGPRRAATGSRARPARIASIG